MTEVVVTTTTPVRQQVGVAVIDEDEAVRSVLIEHVRSFEAGAQTYESIHAFQDESDPLSPAVVVIGPSFDPDEAVHQAERLLLLRQNYGVVMVVYDLSTRLLQQALRAGVVDVVAVAAEDDELVEALTRATARVERQMPRPVAPLDSTPGAAPEGQVITVFCTKGGAGKSVTAVNLAVTLARRTIQPVVLVDADLQFGDIALMLQLQPSHTIMDAVQAGERVDRNLVERILLRHEPSGLLVLAAPTEPTSADQIGRDDLIRILSVLKDMCAYIVIDTSPNFGEVTLAALESSNDILVLAGLDVMSLKSARVGLQTMRVLGIPFSKVKFVLNRANTRVGLTEADAEHALQLKVDVALPSELDVAASVNRGSPVVLSSPKSKFTKSIENLAILLTSQRVAT
jgi:pilus assembly protein CpaE